MFQISGPVLICSDLRFLETCRSNQSIIGTDRLAGSDITDAENPLMRISSVCLDWWRE